jgi:hypothetical protein
MKEDMQKLDKLHDQDVSPKADEAPPPVLGLKMPIISRAISHTDSNGTRRIGGVPDAVLRGRGARQS